MSLVPKKSKHYKLDLVTIALIEMLVAKQEFGTNTRVVQAAVYHLAKSVTSKDELEKFIHAELKTLNIPEQYWKG